MSSVIPEKKIYLTDKNGIEKEKTDEVSDIRFDEDKKLWSVRFGNSERAYYYKPENVRIIRNCLSERKSGSVYDYLLKTAAFSEIENSNGDNLLVKTLERNRVVDEKSALALYLNPEKTEEINHVCENFIFPFGCNNSQYRAVTTALGNRITVIQGPPGTGKRKQFSILLPICWCIIKPFWWFPITMRQPKTYMKNSILRNRDCRFCVPGWGKGKMSIYF